MWLSHKDVPYDKRGEYEYNLYHQFSKLYLPVVALVQDVYGDRDGPWNYDLVNNRVRYGLSLKDIDPPRTLIHYE